MRYVNLGATGLRVSRICLGMMSYGKHESREWTLDEKGAEPIVRRAVEGGITFFDTADVYNGGQSEVITGRLLRKLFEMREEYVVATKVHGQTMPGENGRGLSRKHIMASIDASLKRLELDYVDLYQIHRWDPTNPDRRDHGGAARRGQGRQGPLHRRQQHVRVAVRQGPGRREHTVRVDAESLQPRLPRGGARDDPAVPRPGRRGAAVESARTRAARRQPHARRRAPHHPREHRPVRRIRCTSPRPTLPSSTARPRSRRSAALRPRRSRSRGCCRSPVSPPRSSAPPSSSTWTTRSRPRS